MTLEFENESTQEQQNQSDFGTRLELEEPEQPKAPEVDNIDDDIEVPAEDQQLDLFGEPAKPKAEATTKKKAAAKPKAKKEPEKVGKEYIVYYAGHRVAVPEDDMTLDEVRSYLECDFPELSADRTEMTVDSKEKQIVPVVKGAKKG
jgi:hypothetical protein